MGAMKVKAFHALLSMGRRVLVSDVDTVRHQPQNPTLTLALDLEPNAHSSPSPSPSPSLRSTHQVWTADPEPYLRSIENVDVGVTSDCL